MKALVLQAVEQVAVTDFPEPELTDDGVKVAVHYCGLCGTDMHKYHGGGSSHPVKLPIPLGHEVSGIVEEVGKNVTKFKVGDRVTVDPNWSCGKCYYCQNGMPHMCENGKGVVKGFAEYVCPPEQNVYHLPDNLSLREACMSEPLSCCIHGMNQLDVKIGQSVVLVGMGAIGTMMIQLIKLAGAKDIIVVEPVEEKKELAYSLGATLFINPLKEDVNQVIKDAGVKNVDRVIECVGSKVTIENSLEYAGKCATVVLFGLSDPNEPALFNQYTLGFGKELTIKNSFINPGTMQKSIDLLAKGLVNADAFIAKELSLHEMIDELANPVYSKKGKVISKIRDENGTLLV